jgi:predicted outer membrane protein
MKFGVLAVALFCVGVASALAQRQETTQQRPGQIDRPVTQPDRPAAQQQNQQQYTARFRGTQGQTAGQGQEVEQYLASCLTLKNQAAIDISQFGQQRAQNPQVKQFAQQLVQDHRQFVEKLQQVPNFEVGASRNLGSAEPYDTNRQTTDTTRLPGSPGANQRDARPGLNDAPATQRLNQDANQSLTADRAVGQGGALKELLTIDKQITERCSQMVREELEAKTGPEFDKCFVGVEIGNHVHMLAALEVIEQQAQGELRQIAQEARPKVQQHLEHAKQLAKQLEGETSGQPGARAERQPSRTQR